MTSNNTTMIYNIVECEKKSRCFSKLLIFKITSTFEMLSNKEHI